jgi:hypothetical protein
MNLKLIYLSFFTIALGTAYTIGIIYYKSKKRNDYLKISRRGLRSKSIFSLANVNDL